MPSLPPTGAFLQMHTPNNSNKVIRHSPVHDGPRQSWLSPSGNQDASNSITNKYNSPQLAARMLHLFSHPEANRKLQMCPITNGAGCPRFWQRVDAYLTSGLRGGSYAEARLGAYERIRHPLKQALSVIPQRL